MTGLFSQLESLIPTLPGWCSVGKAQTLASAVIALRPKLSVDIGVFGGRGLISLALAHQAISDGIVWGIDPWDRAIAVAHQTTPTDEKWWAGLDYEALYNGVLNELTRLRLGERVRIYRQCSSDVTPPANIGILHIDGAHDEEAILDVQRFAANVIPGGLVFTDDENWTGGGVRRSVSELQRMGFRSLYKLGTGGVYQSV